MTGWPLSSAGRRRVAIIVCGALLATSAGCSCTRRPPQRERAEKPTAEKPPQAPQEKPAKAEDPAAARPPAAAAPRRPQPSGRPARTAECGHAVAFAGWLPDEAGARDVVLVCDPADNAIEKTTHVWAGKPRELPVHFGRQRPTIVLQPAGTFTITGAVVALPRSAAAGATRMRETRATALPDLSQDLSPRWPGLCGPTSAADVLFCMHDRDADVLEDFPRGPGDDADAGVLRLIAGGREQIEATSLAGRMGVAVDGNGVTNEGMRLGLASWLDDVDPEAWEVRLDWFDDDPAERLRDEQRAFLGRLAAAVDAGGGAILCLWPGTDFADKPIGDADDADCKECGGQAGGQAGGQGGGQAGGAAGGQAGRQAANAGGPRGGAGDREAPALPDAGFPDLPPAAGRPGGLPGRGEKVDPAQARADAARKMKKAKEALQDGNAARALELAADAVSLLHEAARRDPEARDELEAALDLCRECDRRLPDRRADPGKNTEFQ